MKLRIKGNSIRLRLLRSEVDRFAAEGRISNEIQFGPDGSPSLKYSLVMSRSVDEPTPRYSDNEIVIEVPEGEARVWAGSDQVDLSSAPSYGALPTILIEKDLACLDRPDDPDRLDAFPHPAKLSCTGKA
jgi:hypothetical protein